MIKENKLLDTAYDIVDKNKYSDDSYEKLFHLFINTTVYKRNNTRAIIKRDIAVTLIFSDILSMFSLIIMVTLVDWDFTSIIAILMIVLVTFYAFGQVVFPDYVKSTYILSVIDDINNSDNK